MSAPIDGGPAFPAEGGPDSDLRPNPGMSLRDYFAGRAMAALIAKVPLFDREGTLGIHAPTVEEIHGIREEIARSAYDYADAMLAARASRSSESGRREGP